MTWRCAPSTDPATRQAGDHAVAGRRWPYHESALVTRLLGEGLKAAAHPGVVYRGGPSGRRAGLAGGPDVWEVLLAARHAPGQGDQKIVGAAEQLGIPARLVRLAVSFAAEYPDEIESRIAANEAAVERARRLAAERERLMAS